MQVVQEITINKLEDLFKAYYDDLTRYAFTIVKQQDEAEDVVQQLFIKLWEKRNDLEIWKDVKSYLFRATYNASINQWKRKQKMQNVQELSQVENHVAAHLNSDSVLSKELEARIEEAIQQLPEKCQEVFRLSRFSELSYKEIADKLGISTKTVENHMGKALRIMRKELSDYLPQVIITLLLIA